MARSQPQTVQGRFDKYVMPIPWSGCWMWTGTVSTSRHGEQFDHGTLNMKREDGQWIPEPAYRVAWRLYVGEIPAGMCVCHKCDNRMCVNPAHLFVGTHRDNSLDMTRKGRHPVFRIGSSHRFAKLNEEKVRAILASDETLNELAERFGVSIGAIGHVRKRRTWRHVQEQCNG